MLEQVAQTGGTIPGNIQGYIGQGSEQPRLIECPGLWQMTFKVPFLSKLFYDFVRQRDFTVSCYLRAGCVSVFTIVIPLTLENALRNL